MRCIISAFSSLAKLHLQSQDRPAEQRWFQLDQTNNGDNSIIYYHQFFFFFSFYFAGLHFELDSRLDWKCNFTAALEEEVSSFCPLKINIALTQGINSDWIYDVGLSNKRVSFFSFFFVSI